MHTAGPWVANGEGEILAKDGKPVAFAAAIRMTQEDLTGNGPATANARMISAAPDLAEATAELLRLIRRAQDRLTDYLCPEGSDDADECMNDLLEMFDGPEQRRIENLARNALSRAKDTTR